MLHEEFLSRGNGAVVAKEEVAFGRTKDNSDYWFFLFLVWLFAIGAIGSGILALGALFLDGSLLGFLTYGIVCALCVVCFQWVDRKRLLVNPCAWPYSKGEPWVDPRAKDGGKT